MFYVAYDNNAREPLIHQLPYYTHVSALPSCLYLLLCSLCLAVLPTVLL